MNFWQFASNSPWLTFFLAMILFGFLESVFEVFCRYFINRPLRAMNIRKHGWPPAHLDADGDFRKQEANGKEKAA